MGIVKEFKSFAMRGNVLDMAVGIIIGTAFGKIISSLVTDVIMPPIGLLLGNVDFSNLKFELKQAVMEGDQVIAEAVSLNYGVFINTLIEFLIIAFSIFMVIKAINKMKKKEEAAPEPDPGPSEKELLSEIRDLLKK